MPLAWVVVADSSSCRLFAAGKPIGPLQELESLVHPEGRMHGRDLVSGQPGRAFDSKGAGRHAMEPQGRRPPSSACCASGSTATCARACPGACTRLGRCSDQWSSMRGTPSSAGTPLSGSM